MNFMPGFGASLRRDGCRALVAGLAAGAALTVATPAFAQDGGEPGAYVVLRGGAQFSSDVNFPKSAKTKPEPAPKPGTKPTPKPVVPPTTPPGFPNSLKGETAFTGELGAGYDFGGFRIEATVGQSSANVKTAELADKDNVAEGKVKALNVGVAGYVDFNPSGPINPFLGAGIGMAQVDLDISRFAKPTTPVTPPERRPGTHLDGSEWAFRWHVDAGLAYQMGRNTAIEITGRYARTSATEFKGKTITVTGTGTAAKATTVTNSYKPSLSSTALMIGVRQKF